MYRNNCQLKQNQRHVHEFTGSVRLAELIEDPIGD